MAKYLAWSALFLVMVTASGCSDLRVIGSAAMREMKADGYNVEQVAYRHR
jgi:TRAP-type C4-dicarboxylate transport system permease large subunit